MAFRDRLYSIFRPGMRRSSRPTDWSGSHGFTAYGGYVDERERDRQLGDHSERHRTFDSILANTSIVAASVRYYLNLVSKAEWTVAPVEDVADAEMYAELLEEMLFNDPVTNWSRIIRRAAMYRFYGFSVQEWRARRREDGRLTIDDIRARPQHTIEQWDIDPETGAPVGIVQRRPQDSEYLYIPRNKALYLVDDSLTDKPTGMGLLRHLVSPAERLSRYLQLEGFGFEVDLRNIPVVRAPLGDLADAVENNILSPEAAKKRLEPLQKFIQNHIKNPQLGLLIDSDPYISEDETGRPSSVSKYGVELLTGSQSGLEEIATAIDRINREMARIMGTEQLLLGEVSQGSYALAKDKTSQFFLLIDSSLTEIRQGIEKDIVDTFWMLNGFPDEAKPELRTEAVRTRDAEEIAATLRDIATAGAPLHPEDPVIAQVRDLMGVERPPDPEDLDMLVRNMMTPPGEDDPMPEDEPMPN